MIVKLVAVSLSALLMAGCANNDGLQPSPSVNAPPAVAVQNADAQGVPVPAGEPPADVVRDLMFDQYREMEQAGGAPMPVTATGQGLQLRAKLFEAQKEKCTPSPQRPPGEFECELVIMVSMTGDGSDPADEEPSEQGARIGVKWDPSGKWVAE